MRYYAGSRSGSTERASARLTTDTPIAVASVSSTSVAEPISQPRELDDDVGFEHALDGPAETTPRGHPGPRPASRRCSRRDGAGSPACRSRSRGVPRATPSSRALAVVAGECSV